MTPVNLQLELRHYKSAASLLQQVWGGDYDPYCHVILQDFFIFYSFTVNI